MFQTQIAADTRSMISSANGHSSATTGSTFRNRTVKHLELEEYPHD